MAGGIKGQAYIDHLYYELGTGGVGSATGIWKRRRQSW
jgi:hypothetical protein